MMLLNREQLLRGMLRWRILNHYKKIKEQGKFDSESVVMLDKILSDSIRREYEEKISGIQEDITFLRDENTSLSIEITEVKYNLQNTEKECNDAEEKLHNSMNEIYMLKKSIENIKDSNRKMQGEYDSLFRAFEHSKNLVSALEEEKQRMQFELEKLCKEKSSSIFTGAANLSIGKIMTQLSQYEVDSLSKINKADIKSEYAQTEICDINNILISQRPSEAKNIKPQK